MKGAARSVALVACFCFGCGLEQDPVFAPLDFDPGPQFLVPEGAGVVDVPVRLTARQDKRAVASYRLRAVDAQNDCQVPDFEAAEGQIEWAPGELESSVQIWVGDDELAEIDERFELELEPVVGLPAASPARLELVIADNDRTALVTAVERGVTPGSAVDQAAPLQAALDDAARLGRGVVVVAPGDYVISSVRLPPGVSLSARGARFLRPPSSAEDAVTIRMEQRGPSNSLPVLVEGLTIDGQRDLQGPYRNSERQDAHLIELRGDPERGGRVLATLERLSLSSGTGSGIKIGSDADIMLCGLTVSELWRDAVTVNGGASAVRIRGVDATATKGTGLWIGAREEGFEQSLALEAEVEDVRIGAGDVEIEGTPGSSIALRRLTMTEPPFRLDALDGSVRIADSVLMLGLPSAEHDYFGPPHDVEITGTTLVVSETLDTGEPAEAARTFAAVSLRAESIAPSPVAPGPGRLVFDRCRFEIGRNVESDDVVYAVDNPGLELSVILRATTLGSGLADFFAPGCSGCSVEP